MCGKTMKSLGDGRGTGATTHEITRTEGPVSKSAPDGNCERESGGRVQFMAWRARTFVARNTLGIRESDYGASIARRNAELVTALVGSAMAPATYELRIIAWPDAADPACGRIEFAMLCRLDNAPAGDAERHAKRIADLQMSFPEVEFERVPDPEIARLLDPFPIRSLVAIRRRSAEEAVATVASEPIRRERIGFGPGPKRDGPSGDDTIVHMYPFVPSGASFERLVHLLLCQDEPVAIACRLRPTRLTPAERQFLEAQIATCERYAQLPLGPVFDGDQGGLSWLRPALRDQAKALQQFQTRALLSLRATAVVLTLEIAGPGSVPLAVADAVAATVTEPPGGVEGGFNAAAYFVGGYRLEDLSGEPAALDAFRALSIHVPIDAARAQNGRLVHLFDPVEATAAFAIPSAPVAPLAGVRIRTWRLIPAPVELPVEGVVIGESIERTGSRLVRLEEDTLARHAYVLGATGTGKTTLLRQIARDHIARGEGVCVIDPHGDLYHDLVAAIPENRIEDVVLMDPNDAEFPVGLNVLEWKTTMDRHVVANQLAEIAMALLRDQFGSAGMEYAGPMFLQHVRLNALLVMSDPEAPGTMLDFVRIFREPGSWKRWLPLKVEDPLLRGWVENVLQNTDYRHSGSEGMLLGEYVASKFENWVWDPRLRNIFGQQRSTVDLRRCMDEGKVVLVNLAKGELTDSNARFLGMVLLARLQAAALARVRTPQAERRPFTIIVDETPSLATPGFASLLSESRKFGLRLVLASQHATQIDDHAITSAIFGNAATLICFRIGQIDAPAVARYFHPSLTGEDLVRMPDWHAHVSTGALPPFTIRTLHDSSPRDASHAEHVIAASRQKYGGRPVARTQAVVQQTLWPD